MDGLTVLGHSAKIKVFGHPNDFKGKLDDIFQREWTVFVLVVLQHQVDFAILQYTKIHYRWLYHVTTIVQVKIGRGDKRDPS